MSLFGKGKPKAELYPGEAEALRVVLGEPVADYKGLLGRPKLWWAVKKVERSSSVDGPPVTVKGLGAECLKQSLDGAIFWNAPQADAHVAALAVVKDSGLALVRGQGEDQAHVQLRQVA